MKAALPDPELFGDENAETLIVSWGSNKGCILDAIKNQKGIAYLHYSYLWPLKTEKLEALAAKAKKTIFVEASYQGHLAKLIKMETGLSFDHQILKYDGRPFFFDELLPQLVS